MTFKCLVYTNENIIHILDVNFSFDPRDRKFEFFTFETSVGKFNSKINCQFFGEKYIKEKEVLIFKEGNLWL